MILSIIVVSYILASVVVISSITVSVIAGISTIILCTYGYLDGSTGAGKLTQGSSQGNGCGSRSHTFDAYGSIVIFCSCHTCIAGRCGCICIIRLVSSTIASAFAISIQTLFLATALRTFCHTTARKLLTGRRCQCYADALTSALFQRYALFSSFDLYISTLEICKGRQ